MFQQLRHLYRFFSSKFSTIHLDYQIDPKARYSADKPHLGLYEKINTRRTSYAAMLHKLLSFQDSIKEIRKCKDGIPETAPCWNNGFLPGLDIFTLYGMLSLYQPKRYIEVGSGNSTKVAYKAITDQLLSTQIICIDPQPRASIKGLANQWHQGKLENIPDLSIFSEMESGDILFIDNSHYAFPNSDVICVFLEILPQLKKGVIVQIHDIYLPYDYPDFMLHRFYNEPGKRQHNFHYRQFALAHLL